MFEETKPARLAFAVIILLSFAMLGSNGSCASTGPYGGPYYPPPGSSGGQSQSFYTPAIGANRVDWCLYWNSQCGEPAASEFCRRMGYDRATAWTPAHNIGGFSSTLVLGDGSICNQPQCDGFQNITCTRGGYGSPGPGPSGSQATFTYEDNTDRWGLDYRSFVPSSADPKQCKNRCRAEAQCRAYTYVKSAVVGGNGRCHLKSAVPAAQANPCCISGVKQ